MRPPTELTKAIRPRAARSAGSSALVTATWPIRLTSIWRRKSSSGTTSSGPATLMPALLTRPSSRAPTRSAAARTAASSVTSSSSGVVPSGALAGSRTPASTSQPDAASRCAVARPMPVEAPVTRARRATARRYRAAPRDAFLAPQLLIAVALGRGLLLAREAPVRAFQPVVGQAPVVQLGLLLVDVRLRPRAARLGLRTPRPPLAQPRLLWVNAPLAPRAAPLAPRPPPPLLAQPGPLAMAPGALFAARLQLPLLARAPQPRDERAREQHDARRHDREHDDPAC